MSPNLPEYTYLLGEQRAELEDALVPEVVWTDEDLCFLSTAEDLDWRREYESEAEADLGASYFYGDGPECRNGTVALNVARQHLADQFRRAHRGLSKEQIDARYHNLYAPAVRGNARVGGRR